MRSQIRARARTAQRRQKLQIGGGVLLVALIWTLALWPSGDQQPASQSVPASGATYTPWTTGPFAGTTPTPSGSSIPTVRESTIATVRPTATAPAVREPPTVTSTATGAPAPVTTPSTSSQPTNKGKGNGKPPKPTGSPSPASGFDLFGIFGL